MYSRNRIRKSSYVSRWTTISCVQQTRASGPKLHRVCYRQNCISAYLSIIHSRQIGKWRALLVVSSQNIPVSVSLRIMHLFPRGVLPFAQRKRLWERYRAKTRKQRPSTSQTEIVCGSQVCMKNSPMYQPGAIGFTVAAGVPKVGQLQNAAWALSDTCTFKLLRQDQPPSQTGERRDSIPGTSGLSKSSLNIYYFSFQCEFRLDCFYWSNFVCHW